MATLGLAGWSVEAWHDIETKRDLTKAESLKTVKAEIDYSTSHDKLQSVRESYIWKRDSMNIEWKREAKRLKKPFRRQPARTPQ